MKVRHPIAIVGATGAVGQVMLDIVLARHFPAEQIYLLASKYSVGKVIERSGQCWTVQNLEGFDFSKVRIALFSAGSDVSAKYASQATQSGCIVIDNTSYFRQEADIPLIVPEVNRHRLAAYRQHNIIANPNCSTIQMVVALKPLHDAAGIARINVATYNAVSGAGSRAIHTMGRQTRAVLDHQALGDNAPFTQPIAFNALPHIDRFMDNGYTREEMKIVWETRKILEDNTIQINPTCVRIPVFYGHSAAVHIETRDSIPLTTARSLLQQAPGVMFMDDPSQYPTAVTHAAHQDAVYVGRLRTDLSHPKGFSMWIVADNLRKGAALNSVQIAEVLVADHLR